MNNMQRDEHLRGKFHGFERRLNRQRSWEYEEQMPPATLANSYIHYILFFRHRSVVDDKNERPDSPDSTRKSKCLVSSG